MTTVLAASPADFQWLDRRVGCARTASFKAIKAVDAFDSILGMVGFDLFTANSCHMHLAARSPIAVRSLVRPAFEYAFRQLGLKIAFGTIAANRKAALRFARHVGFKIVHRSRDGWADGVDLFHLEARASDCRWLTRPIEATEAVHA